MSSVPLETPWATWKRLGALGPIYDLYVHVNEKSAALGALCLDAELILRWLEGVLGSSYSGE